MSGNLAFVIHSDPDTAARVADALEQGGFRTGKATSPAVARQLLEALVPEVALVEVALLRRDDGEFQRWWKGSEDLARLPVVALANGRPETRRDALRLGLTNVLTEPFDPEELVLAARAAVGESGGTAPAAAPPPTAAADPSPTGGELRGSLDQLPVADLLSMIEIHRRTALVSMERDGLRAIFRYEKGQLASGELSDGRRGEDALGEVLSWRRGTFTAHLGQGAPAPSPARAAARSASEAAGDGALARRAQDSAEVPARQAEVDALFTEDGDAGEDLEPWRISLHLTLSTLNLAISYASATASPERVAEAAEEHRRRLEGRYPSLRMFFADEAGVVSLRPGVDPTVQPAEVVEAAARIWLQDLFDDLGQLQPADFARHVLDGFIASVTGDGRGDGQGGGEGTP